MYAARGPVVSQVKSTWDLRFERYTQYVSSATHAVGACVAA